MQPQILAEAEAVQEADKAQAMNMVETAVLV
jgi:hypothetical protein